MDASLLRKFKKEWEGEVERRRRSFQSRSEVSRAETELTKFEIKKVLYSLNTKKTNEEINAAIDYLYNWHLMEDGYRGYIIDNLGLLFWFLDENQTRIVADRLYDFFWELIGPDEVPMRRGDQGGILSAIELLGDIGAYAALLDYKPSTVKKALSQLLEFSEIGNAYKNKRIRLGVQKQLRKIRKEWEEEFEREKTSPKTKEVLAEIDRATKSFGTSR